MRLLPRLLPCALLTLLLATPLAAPAAASAAAAPALRDLTVRAATSLYDARTNTGDVNVPAVTIDNRSRRTAIGTVQVQVPARARLLGVVTSWSSGGSFGRPVCQPIEASSTQATRVACPVRLQSRATTLVVAVVGVATPGASSIEFAVSPSAPGAVAGATRGASASYRASGRTCTVLGSNGAFAGSDAPETLTGTAGADVLCGFGGQDVCRGSLFGRLRCSSYQPDTIRGGDGDDVVLLPAVNSVRGSRLGDDVDLGAGQDTLVNADSQLGAATAVLGAVGSLAQRHGSSRATHVVRSAEAYEGGRGMDSVTGSDAPETISGGGGDDELVGGGGDDLLLGGSGDDFLFGGAGVDRLDGGAGTFDAAGAGTTGGSTVDLAARTIRAGGEVDSLAGIEGAFGTPAADVLVGTSATNAFYAGPGTDTILGAGGIDVISFERMRAGMRIDAARGTATSRLGRISFRDIESFVGSGFADVFSGTSGLDVFDAAGGNDRVDGMGGDDILSGGAGNDNLRGGAGRDELNGDAGRDTLFGGPERDRCRRDPRSYVTDC